MLRSKFNLPRYHLFLGGICVNFTHVNCHHVQQYASQAGKKS